MSDVSDMPPITCVACGQDHIKTEQDIAAAVRVGISYIARECRWSLRYPGQEAWEVIESLEARPAPGGGRTEEVRPVAGASEPGQDSGPDSASDDDEPDVARFPSLTGATEKLCPVCRGDGELLDPESGEVTPCGRCNATGRIQVVPA